MAMWIFIRDDGVPILAEAVSERPWNERLLLYVLKFVTLVTGLVLYNFRHLKLTPLRSQRSEGSKLLIIIFLLAFFWKIMALIFLSIILFFFIFLSLVTWSRRLFVRWIQGRFYLRLTLGILMSRVLPTVPAQWFIIFLVTDMVIIVLLVIYVFS